MVPQMGATQDSLDGQFLENPVNSQWIELQPLYQHHSFAPGMPPSAFTHIADHNMVNNTGAVGSTGPPSPGPKSGEPDPIIEAIVEGNGYHELKFEIQQMLKLVLSLEMRSFLFE